MKNPEIKTNIEIQGAILTDLLIKELIELQDDENRAIGCNKEVL